MQKQSSSSTYSNNTYINKNIHVISFDSNDEMDKAFFELIHNSNSGLIGISEIVIGVNKEQLELLKRKNIKYNILKKK